MHYYQTSLFYDLQELILKSPLLRKYYYLFKALDLSALPDKNNGVGAKGYSRHAMLRAFIVKHFEQIKSVPRLDQPGTVGIPANLSLRGAGPRYRRR